LDELSPNPLIGILHIFNDLLKHNPWKQSVVDGDHYEPSIKGILKLFFSGTIAFGTEEIATSMDLEHDWVFGVWSPGWDVNVKLNTNITNCFVGVGGRIYTNS